ncbi:MAG: nuclear transport factor 2 family protein [Phycisphaerales bacterium JB059]
MRRRIWFGLCGAVAIGGALGLGRVGAPGVGVDAVMDAFHAAASEADFEGYFALMHDDGVFLGTDASERWTKAQFMDYARPVMVEQGKGWTYHPRDRHVSVRGDVAWFDELIENEKYGTLRGQGVLVREGGDWRVAQYSYSFAVPNEKAPGVVELILSEDAPERGAP